MTLSEKLKKARSQAGLSQKELAEKLDMNLRTYGSYERGERDLSTAILLKICKALNISSDYLLGREPPKNEFATIPNEFNLSNSEQSHIKKYRALDEYGKQAVDSILNVEYERCTYVEEPEDENEDFISLPYSLLKASAGVGDWLDEEQFDKIKVKDTPEARKADMVIEVDGHSMEPDYCDGDKVLVRLQPDIYIGEVGIFIWNGNGYIKELGEKELISVNPEYDNIPIDEYNECRCVGKVVGIAEE